MALKVLILAGGGEAAENQNSHLVHVQRLSAHLIERGVPQEDIAIFWADGTDKQPDRAVLADPADPFDWLVQGTAIDAPTAPTPTLVNTTFKRPVQPAKRAALQAWLVENGPKMGPEDTLLIAVTDHGEPGPQGGDDARITLWGESWAATELREDLVPVPKHTRVVLWLSQCFSGGFAQVAETRDNLCGAFSASPDRPSYGCYPELAGRTEYGHFHRMVEALAHSDALGPAAERVAVLDQSPDTPHLTSDAFAWRALDAHARAQKLDLPRLIDNRLSPLEADHPIILQAGRIAARFGLGPVASYDETLVILETLDRARFALTVTADDWRRALAGAIDNEIEDLARRIGEPRGPKRKARARQRGIREIRKILERDETLAGRVEQLHQRVVNIEALESRLEQQEAAAIRLAYVFTRAGVSALSAAEQAYYAKLRGCEQAPILPPPSVPAEPLVVTSSLPPVWRLMGDVEAASPGFLGVGYRDRPRHQGVVVERFGAMAPAAASALQVGDEIHAVNGWTLKRRGDFRETVRLLKPGSVAQLEVQRNHSPLTVPVVVAASPLPPITPIAGDTLPPLRLVPYDKSVPLPLIGEGQPVVLFYWATWCKPCKRAIAPLAKWAIANQAAVIAITQEPAATVKRWKKRNREFPLPIALDQGGAASRLFRVDRTPVFVRLDANARVVKVVEGFTDTLDLEEAQ